MVTQREIATFYYKNEQRVFKSIIGVAYDIYVEITVHSVEIAVHSLEITAHFVEIIVHSLEITGHSVEITVHSVEITVHSLEITVHSLEKIRCFYFLRHFVNVATTGLRIIAKIMNCNFT